MKYLNSPAFRSMFIDFFSIVFCIIGIVILILVFWSSSSGTFHFYGLEGGKSTFTGMLIIAVYLFKGVVGYSFLTTKSFRFGMAKIDAISGIVICWLVMLFDTFQHGIFPYNGTTMLSHVVILLVYLHVVNKMEAAEH
ncbi:MAG: hypothetical protein EOO07_29280 [Chitinophagaceae bacterium]|nr:MAG: hypothetical protein EOO07_29280 [Chitinophagaceae bacterium]